MGIPYFIKILEYYTYSNYYINLRTEKTGEQIFRIKLIYFYIH